jgi:hypothetical protein
MRTIFILGVVALPKKKEKKRKRPIEREGQKIIIYIPIMGQFY